MSTVLITAPQRIAQQTFRCELAVNDSQDRLSDHVTGEQIGGMLLMKVARQVTIASV
jgi:hypothetical protein